MQDDLEETNEEYERDEDGNVIFPKVDYSWAEYNRWHSTHIFYEWDDEYGGNKPIAFLMRDLDLVEQKEELERDNIIVYKLFQIPEKADSYHFNHHGWFRSLAYNFFKEVFKLDDDIGGLLNEIDLARIIIKKKTFDEIIQLISDNGLNDIKDLIFYIIAKIGHVYVDEIEYYVRPEMVKQMNNAGKEVEKLTKIIERVCPDFEERYNQDPKPLIRNIVFDFPDIEPIKIKDPRLMNLMVNLIKKYYGEGMYRNWRKEIKRFASSYDEEIKKQKYKFHVAIALQNFFTYLKKFPTKQGAKTTDAEMLCIAKILEFGLIKIGKDDISDADKIKNIRNYIKPDRHQLPTYQSHIETHPRMDMLLKYFDNEFLCCVLLEKHIDIIKEAYYISDRFDILHIKSEIAHLIDCIKRRKEQIGWEFSTQGIPTETHPVIGSLFNLISPFRSDKETIRLTELSFQLENKPESHTIKDALPLMLIERALNEYYLNHQEEFDVDIFTSKIHDTLYDGSYRVEELGQYQKQGERFLPVLCLNLYKFLLNEVPPEKTLASATNKYSEIIAVILQRCLVFNQVMDKEHVIQAKVKQWLKEAKMAK